MKVIEREVSYVQPRNWGERCEELKGPEAARFKRNSQRKRTRKARRPGKFEHPRFQTPLRGNRYDYTD